ncbi:hypothetical protein CIG1485E_0935 [Campylobacter iguaniorum]|uniref:Outer membrane protein n=1 Tax=Campylobacter iguaniorum TaxID=1244531 RepID=A0A076FAQ9_9BACT|nr:hypothetical protein [Campylobacter iguaniorum]AII14773.1 hypothetical protein CIG1485E_0935 [Campylobacter iguaniorum]
MKILAYVFAIFVALFTLIYAVLFSSAGNKLLKPYIENYATQKSGIPIKLSSFTLTSSTLNTTININQDLNLDINASFNLFSQSFDMSYKLSAATLKNFGLNWAKEVSLSGNANGKLKNFIANGSGIVAGSDIKFSSRVLDFAPKELKLDAKGLNIDELLVLANQKPYATGKLNLVADIAYKDQNQSGNAKLMTVSSYLNSKLIKDDFNITLPANFALNLSSDIAIQNQIVHAKTVLSTPIAVAAALNTLYDMDKNEITSDFNLGIPNLAKLEPIIKQKLNGEILLKGNAKAVQGKLDYLDADIKGLGGTVSAKLKDSQIDAQIKNLKLSQILKLASIAPLADGDINGIVKINELNEPALMSGTANLQISKANLKSSELNKIIDSSLKSNIDFALNTNINIDKGLVKSNSSLNSDLLQVSTLNANYDLNTKNSNISLKADVSDLGKFKEIINQELNGKLSLQADAKLKADKLENLNLLSNAFGGEIKASLQGQNLKASVKNASLHDLFVLTNQKPLGDGVINADINLSTIDIKNLNGNGVLSITNGKLNQKNMSELLGKEFPKNVEFSLNSKPNFTNSIVYFSSNLNSNLAKITKFDGEFDINKNILNANYIANIANLSSLEFITGAKLNGELNANGKVKFDKNLQATLNSKLFRSELKSSLNDNLINLNIDKFAIADLLKMLGYAQFYEGSGNLKANYDLSTQKGKFDADILEGKLSKSELTNTVSLILNRDITSEVYKNGYIKGDINQNLVTFKEQMSSPKSDINVTKGTINLATKALNIPIDMNVEKTDISVKITGTTQNPKYDAKSNYLQNKIEKGLEKLLGGKESNSTKSNDAKELIKGLKSLF